MVLRRLDGLGGPKLRVAIAAALTTLLLASFAVTRNTSAIAAREPSATAAEEELLVLRGRPFQREAISSEFTDARISSSERTSHRQGTATASSARHSAASAGLTQLSDIFIGVKTSGNFHKSRLQLLFDTWIPLANGSAHVFTDAEDPNFRSIAEAAGVDMINTHCSPAYHRQGLSCKLSVEFDAYLQTDKRWFCHVDDDMYINVNSLQLLLRSYNHEGEWYLGKTSQSLDIPDPFKQGSHVTIHFADGGAGFCLSQGLVMKIAPYVRNQSLVRWSNILASADDMTLGYIVYNLAKQSLTEVPLLHSHFERLLYLNDTNIGKQVTFSYKFVWDHYSKIAPNVVSVKGSPAFNISNDPSRMLTAHCLMFPSTSQCDAYRA